MKDLFDEQWNCDFWNQAKDWDDSQVHPSRLLNPASYLMSSDPIWDADSDTVDLRSLVVFMAAVRLLKSLTYSAPRQLERIVKQVVPGLSSTRASGTVRRKISQETHEICRGIQGAWKQIEDQVALTTEYIVRNKPEAAGLVQEDKTRFHCWNWFHYILEYHDAEALGFEDIDGLGSWEYLPDPEYFDPSTIKSIERPHMEEAVGAISDMAVNVNFAIETGCRFVNYFNYFAFAVQSDLRQTRKDEGWSSGIVWRPKADPKDLAMLKAPEDENGFKFLNRHNEMVYRQRQYNLGSDIEPEMEYHRTGNKQFYPLNFVMYDCPEVGVTLTRSLKILKEHRQSVIYKGKELERLLRVADELAFYNEQCKTVKKWYYDRIDVVNDEDCRSALEYLSKNKDMFNLKAKEHDAFMADQRIVLHSVQSGDQLPDPDSLKKPLDAVEKLSPKLKELGLKIVPIDEVTVPLPKPDGPSFSDKIMQSELERAGIQASPFPFHLSKEGWNALLGSSPEGEIIEGELTVEGSEQGKSRATDTDDGDKHTAYTREQDMNERLVKWKDHPTYKHFLDKLGAISESGQCTVAQIGAIKQGKRLKTDQEQYDTDPDTGKSRRIKGTISANSAKNAGRKFLDSANIEPCHNYDTLTRKYAQDRVLGEAARKKHGEAINGEKARKAVESLQKAKPRKDDPDKAFKTHLRKLKLKKADETAYLDRVEYLDGRKVPKSSAKYHNTHVAVAFAEDELPASEKKDNSK